MKNLKNFNNFLNEFSNNLEPLIDFVQKESYFVYDNKDDDSITFVTRENGNVGSETVGQEDIKEATRLQGLIKNKFKYTSNIEEVDEWVHLVVILKEKESKVIYSICKHDGSLDSPGWRGFSETHPVEELAKQITRWTDIKPQEAEAFVKQLTETEPEKEYYNGKYAEIKLPSKAMGYNWTIRKKVEK